MDKNNEKGVYNIACVIVTYNRKELLKKCLDALDAQVLKPAVVFITDNASTDGTLESVKEWGYYKCIRNGIHYKYILNFQNDGGAGGFYLGIKTAIEDNNYDGIWVMDDDGIPDRYCLRELCNYLNSWDFISPLVISTDNSNILSFYDITKNEFEKKAVNGVVENASNPFNGILLSRKLIEIVGYPMKEMFIWGDETNYRLRTENAGFTPITIVSAKHFHPKDRQKKIKAPFVNRVIAVSDVDWKQYYFIRNMTYNYLYVDKTSSIKRIPTLLYIILSYLYYFTINGNKKMRHVVIKAFRAGILKNFARFV